VGETFVWRGDTDMQQLERDREVTTRNDAVHVSVIPDDMHTYMHTYHDHSTRTSPVSVVASGTVLVVVSTGKVHFRFPNIFL